MSDRPASTSRPPDFTPAEVAYLGSQRLARIATAGAGGRVDVAPVGFRFEGGTFVVGGHDLPRTFKYRHVKENERVALVLDDLVTVRPWRVRGIKVHGTAEIVRDDTGSELIRIVPTRKWSWGMGEDPAR